jgi:hypothetical protein
MEKGIIVMVGCGDHIPKGYLTTREFHDDQSIVVSSAKNDLMDKYSSQQVRRTRYRYISLSSDVSKTPKTPPAMQHTSLKLANLFTVSRMHFS